MSHSGWNLRDENEGLGHGSKLRASSHPSPPFLLQGASVVPHSDTQDEKSEGRVGAATALFPSGQSQMVPVHLSLSFL